MPVRASRLGVAFLVAFAAFAGTDLAFAVAAQQAQDDEALDAANATAPPSFVLPAVALGDGAAYDLARVEQHDETSERRIALAWETGETLRLGNGRDVLADALVATTWRNLVDDQPYEQRTWFDGGSAIVVARGQHGLTVRASSDEIPGVPVRTNGGSDYLFDSVQFDGLPETCTLAGRWAGLAIGVATLELPACDGPELDLPVGLSLATAGVETLDGRQVARYSGNASGHSIEVLLAEGISVPMHVVHSWAESETWTIRTYANLTGFMGGTSPRTGVPSPLVEHAPKPAVGLAVAGRRVLLDEQDAPFPFTLAEAWRTAEPALARFLLDHPDAFVAGAWMENVDRAGAKTIEWDLFVQDDAAAVRVLVARPDFPLPDVIADAMATAVTFEDAFAETGVEAPVEVPRAADLAAVYGWYSGNTPNCYGYWLDARGYSVHVGRCDSKDSSGPTVSPPGFVFGGRFGHDFLNFDAAGMATWYESSTTGLGAGATAEAPLMPGPPESHGPPPGILHAAIGLSAPQWVAASTVAVGASLLVLLWPVLKGLPGGLGLFTRLREPELLKQPTRARIHALVEASPGIHFGELQRRSGVANGTLVHHLRALRTGGLVVAKENGNYTSYFVRGDRPTPATLSLRSEGARLVWASVQAMPGISNAGLAERTSLTASTVSYHLRSLERNGLVRIERTGARVRVFRAGA